MVKITHPTNPSYAGRRCGLTFTNGQALTEGPLDESQRFHFKRWKFTIEGDTPEKTSKSKKSTAEGEA